MNRETLHLQNAALEMLPSLSGHIIRDLRAARNSIRVLWVDQFPRGLQILDLDSNSLLDDGLLDIWPDTIQRLILSNNPFRSLDVVVQWPAALKVLDLTATEISGTLPALPDGLEELYVSSTRIRRLGRLPPALRILEAAFCAIRNAGLPAAWPAGLERLDLHRNSLRQFPRGLPAGLKSLNLSDNFIGDFGRREEFPPALEFFAAGRNRIREIPTWLFSVAPHLLVTIQENCLTRVPTPIERFPAFRDQWYSEFHDRLVTRIQRQWRIRRARNVLRIWRRNAVLRETLIATAMHPDRAGLFQDVSAEWGVPPFTTHGSRSHPAP